MTIKRHIRSGLILLIESDANITTLIVRASKKQLLKIVDILLSDDSENLPASKFSLRDEK